METELRLTVNGAERSVTCEPDTPLLEVLRNDLGLAGPRFGCGTGLCGACFALVGDRARSSCDLPVSAVDSPSGSQLGRAATRDTAAAATLITLVPGDVAHATIQVANAQNYSASQCSPVTAHYLRIYPPNQFTAISARYTVLVCSAKLPHTLGSQLHVFVVRPGAGKAGQAP